MGHGINVHLKDDTNANKLVTLIHNEINKQTNKQTNFFIYPRLFKIRFEEAGLTRKVHGHKNHKLVKSLTTDVFQ